MASNDQGNQLPPHLATLLEKIRAKANHYKPWPEIVKLTKAAFVDRRSVTPLDAQEKAQVEKALDTIQKSIEVKGVKSMVERLESISKQLGLKITCPTGRDVFISSDMFYVEVVLDPSSGFVVEVKIAHQTDPLPCPELTNVLRAGDFAEFTKHLEGLCSIYQLNADSKQKTKAYMALHSLEYDLTTLSQYQSNINDINTIIHKTPVGILEQRKGGHAVKLTFFISPYDLLDRKSKSSLPLSVDTILSRKLGYSATVCIESSTKSHKLQTQSLISKSSDGRSLPQFGAFSNLNSSILPARFVLKLTKPLPTSVEFLRKIATVTSIDLWQQDSTTKAQPLIKLIAKSILPEKEAQKLDNEIDASVNDKSYYAKLPDQQHAYFIHEQGHPHLEGILLTSIPFTHPTHVPQILVFLRQQVLFNVVVGSCIRKLSSFEGSDATFSFEVTSSSMYSLSVSFEHPVEETLASLEVDLNDIIAVKCKLYEPSSFNNLLADDYVTKVMQRSLSLPVTLRMIILKTREKSAQLKEQEIKAQQQSITQNKGQGELGTSSGLIDSNITSFLSQQFPSFCGSTGTSSAGSESSSTAIGVAVDAASILRDRNFLQNLAMSNLTPAQKIAIIQNLQFQQQQLLTQRALSGVTTHQAALQQSLMSRQVGLIAIPSGQQGNLQPSQQQQAPQQSNLKGNTMLLNMLSDVPAANQSASLMATNFALYQQLQQQQQQDFLLGQKKKTRKRKNTDPGGMMTGCTPRNSGSPSMGKGPKRKFSEEDAGLSDSLGGGDAFGESLMTASSHSSPSHSRPSSSGPCDRRTSVEQFFQSQDPSAFLAASSPVVHLLQRSLSTGGMPSVIGLSEGISGNMVFDSQQPQSATTGGRGRKRTSSRVRSSDEPSNFVGPDEPFAFDTSSEVFANIRPSSAGSTAPLASHGKSSKGRSPSNDGGRSSSAGLDDISKVRKRKRSESVDSIKSGLSSPSPSASPIQSLMPPPPEVSTSSVMVTSADSAIASIAVRPLTLNVKPMSESLASSSSKGKGSSTISSSTIASSSKSGKGERKLSRQELVSGSQFTSPSPSGCGASSSKGKGATLSKLLTKSVAPPASSVSGSKMKQGSGLKLKSSSQVSSSIQGRTITILNNPPVSSSSQISCPFSGMAPAGSSAISSEGSSSPTTSATSSCKTSQTSMGKTEQQPATSSSQVSPGKKKSLGSLSAVIDKLSKNVSITGSVGAMEVSSESSAKAESTSGSTNRPDSSSKTGVKTSTGVKGARVSTETPSQSGAQTTFKATLSGSKLTISKKPTSTTDIKAVVKGKPSTSGQSPSGPRPSSSMTAKGKASPAGLVKKNFPGKAASSGVSSSSSLLTPPKGTTGRSVPIGKVAAAAGVASAILEEAIPRLRLDQLPKIPKSERASTTSSMPQGPQPAVSTTPSFYRRKSTQGPPPEHRTQTSNVAQSSSQAEHHISSASSSAQASTAFYDSGPALRPIDSSIESGGQQVRFQSNAVSSSEGRSSSQDYFVAPSISNSSITSEGISFSSTYTYTSASALPATFVSPGGSGGNDSNIGSSVLLSPPTSSVTAATSISPLSAATSSSSTASHIQPNVSPAKNGKAAVTSSSDTPSSPVESTPSSPVEAVAMAVDSAPLIIPIESCDDNSEAKSSAKRNVSDTDLRDRSQNDERTSGDCSSSGQETKDQEEEEDDDVDGLIIDDTIDCGLGTSTPIKRDSTDEKETFHGEAAAADIHSGPASPSPSPPYVNAPAADVSRVEAEEDPVSPQEGPLSPDDDTSGLAMSESVTTAPPTQQANADETVTKGDSSLTEKPIDRSIGEGVAENIPASLTEKDTSECRSPSEDGGRPLESQEKATPSVLTDKDSVTGDEKLALSEEPQL